LDVPDEMFERIFEEAKMSIRLQKYKTRRMQWKKLIALLKVNKQWYRVIGKEGSEEINVRFVDLPLKAKRLIFESVARAVSLRGGGYSYESQADDCKKLVACRCCLQELELVLDQKSMRRKRDENGIYKL
jgi:predicted ABC-class ATPase